MPVKVYERILQLFEAEGINTIFGIPDPNFVHLFHLAEQRGWNVVALEGASAGVKSNVIVPAALTRMAEGLDTSAYPPMDPELAAPAVGWLAHESCSITGELLVSIAGRVARAFVAETPGVYRPSWSIGQVGEQIAAIRDTAGPWVLAPVPSGQADHIVRSFAMATEGA